MVAVAAPAVVEVVVAAAVVVAVEEVVVEVVLGLPSIATQARRRTKRR